MLGTSLSPRHDNFLEVIKSYYQLTKPRIIPLLLIKTAASMWIASNGDIDPVKLVLTMLGGTLAAASAQTLDCIYDQDIDFSMQRTRKRPIPSGRVQPRHALIFAMVLGGLSFSILAIFVNLLSACLAFSGIVFYMLIYTHWLKRNHVQNIVIGGAAGSIPPLVGWAAVTGHLDRSAWILFALIFLWTPPHFWALALMIKDDYAEVNVPMLPVVEGEQVTVDQIWIYTLITVPFSLLLVFPLHSSGLIYMIAAVWLGVIFIKKAWELKQNPFDKPAAKSMFKYSILYMMLLCTAMVVDSLPAVHQMAATVTTTLASLG